MKKVVKKIALLLIVFGIGVGVTLLYTNNKYKVYDEEEPKQIKKHVDTISMMLETEANSGNYELTTRESWPTEGYVFNSELSVCENGSELSWDDANKTVLMSGNVSDKCYVYFDVYVPPTIADFCNSGDTLTTCVKNFGNQGTDMSNIYIHNSGLTNGAGDNSYRYAGASESVNNFVCFGSTTPCPTDNLYRIIGVFGDQVKLIKYDYATSTLLGTDGDYYAKYPSGSSTYKGSNYANIAGYYWNNSTKKNTWSESELNKTNLNTNFITNIGTEWAQKIAMTTWKVGGNTWAKIGTSPMYTAYQNEITHAVTTNTTDEKTEYSAQIGLMYVSDYGYAASPTYWTYPGYSSSGASSDYRAATTSNWMYMGLYDWTISRIAGGSDSAFSVYFAGSVYSNNVGNGGTGVRPSFNLITPTTYYGGTGSMSDPIKLREIGKFTIDDTVLQIGYPNVTCDFEIGMTWREFINSGYNTVGLKSNGSEAYFPTDYKPGDEDYFIIPGSLDDLIENNETYGPAV